MDPIPRAVYLNVSDRKFLQGYTRVEAHAWLVSEIFVGQLFLSHGIGLILVELVIDIGDICETILESILSAAHELFKI